MIFDGPSSHTELTGFETFVFTDGTVNNADGNPLVDDLFYYARHHDVWNAHIDAELHYGAAGRREGRDPNAFFDTSFYRAIYPDAGADPLAHFDTLGWTQGRAPSLDFDAAKYLSANPDVAAAHVDPLWHFLAIGASEGRQPFALTQLLAANGFDIVYYLQHNPGRGCGPYRSAAALPDGRLEGRPRSERAVRHQRLSGDLHRRRGGRDQPARSLSCGRLDRGPRSFTGFDTTSYLAAYPDVAAAHIDPLLHFLQVGFQEGRSAFADGVWG